MVDDWVTLPLGQLVEPRTDGVGAVRKCRLCRTQTVPSTEQTADEQFRFHLERDHFAVAETATTRVGARLRAKLIEMDWTPPADGAPGSQEPPGRPTPPPAVE